MQQARQRIPKFIVEPIADEETLKRVKACGKGEGTLHSKVKAAGLLDRVVQQSDKLFQMVPVPEGKKPPKNRILTHHESLLRDASTETYSSAYEGLFLYSDYTPQVRELYYDGLFEVNVDRDDMKATLNLYPPGPNGAPLTIEEVFSKINGLRLWNVDEEAVKRAFRKMTDEDTFLEDVLVASGVPPKDGRDGYVEYYINASSTVKPSVTEDGRIDFYNLNVIQTVDKDQKIALVHPHEDGAPGRNVFGEPLPAASGKPATLPTLKNIYRSPEDENLLLAKIDGNVTVVGDSIHISPGHVVDGDVDIRTGNISVKGSLKVRGGVKNGFKVNVAHACEIDDEIEDADVIVGGALRVRRGFVGAGKGVIRAGGDVHLHFVRNQTIYSRGSIFINNEAMDAKLHALHQIVVRGKKMSIVGGYVIAGDLVEAENIGNIYNVPTTIEVGYDYNAQNEIEKNKKELVDLDDKLAQILLPLDRIAKAGGLNDQQRKAKAILLEQKELISAKIEKIKKRNLELEKTFYTPSNARVYGRVIYPGVRIMINKKVFTVREEMYRKTIALSKEEGFVVS